MGALMENTNIAVTTLLICSCVGIIFICALALQKRPESGAAAIVFDAARALSLSESGLFGRVCALSEHGDMREAASRLFALLHELDLEGFETIHAERVPEDGLGRAINDRLWRASAK